MTPIDYNNPNDNWMQTGYDPYKGMTDDERMKAGCLQLVSYIVVILFGLLLCALFGSCKSVEYVPVIEHQTDTLIQTKVVKDSVYLKDSTHVSEKNDTVKIEHWHTEFLKKEVHDTVYISKTDSVPAPYPVEVVREVPAELTMWEQLKMKVGGIAILLCIFAFLLWIWRSR
jgi:hypothetical protein